MRQSPLTVTYAGLLDFANEILKDSQDRYLMAKGRGTTNLDPLASRVEKAKTLVRMLRKGLPKKQTDFFALFNEVQK